MKADTHPAVEELKSLLHDQPGNPLRLNQVQHWQGEIERLERQAGEPAAIGGTARGFARRRLQQIKRMMDTQTAKKVTEEPRRSRIDQLTGRVLQEVIVPRLLTRAESDRNPPGAVGHQLRHGEFSKPFKDAALTWKRGMRALDPDNDDPDFTNYARFQSSGIRADGTSTFMANAQVPGAFAQSPLAKARWPLGDPTIETPLKQARRRDETTSPTGKKRGRPPRVQKTEESPA